MSVVAKNMVRNRFCGISGIGCGFLSSVMAVPSVWATMVPDAKVV